MPRIACCRSSTCPARATALWPVLWKVDLIDVSAFFEREVGTRALQLRVLLLEQLRPFYFLRHQTAILLAPVAKRRFEVPSPVARLGQRHAALNLLQQEGDLCLREL